MKKLTKLLVSSALLFAAVQSAQAVPAFARQMKAPCSLCHQQHIPMLNSFGRAFKASGYTMSAQADTDITDGKNFSLPGNLNFGLVTNVRVQKSNGPKGDVRTSNNGEFTMPGETSLFFGGKVADHVGGLIEADVKGGLASEKIMITKDVKNVVVGVVPFSAGLGPSYGMETLNTGAVGNHIMNLALGGAISAQQWVQTDGNANGEIDQAAEGVALYAMGDSFMVSATQWSPNALPIDNAGAGAPPSSTYLRGVLFHQVGDFDGALGAQVYTGGSDIVGDGGMSKHYATNAYAVDGQLLGQVFGRDTSIMAAYETAPGSNGTTNLYNPNHRAKSAASLNVEHNLTNSFSVQLAYRMGDSGTEENHTDNAATVGVSYMYAPNVQFALSQTMYSGSAHSANGAGGIDASGSGTQLTTANLFVGW